MAGMQLRGKGIWSARGHAVGLCAVAMAVVLSLSPTTRAVDRANPPTKVSPAAKPAVAAKPSPAADLAVEAQLVVRELTGYLLAQSRAQIKDGGDQDIFFAQIAQTMTEMVSFRHFALGVMGVYGSAKSLAALSPAELELRAAQIDRFAELFLVGLVRNYGGIFLTVLRLGDITVETLPGKAASATGKVTVEQLVAGVGSEPIHIYYRLQRRQAEGRWELLNIALDKLNFGKLFRSQFYALSAEHDGDLDQVIGKWSQLETVQTEASGGGRSAEKAKPSRGTGATR